MTFLDDARAVVRAAEVGESASFSCRNTPDGRTYHASLIWRRQAIAVEEAALSGGFEIAQHTVFGEGWVSRGLLGFFLRPVLVFSYSPSEPTDPRPKVFHALVRAIVEEGALSRIAEGVLEWPLYELCEPYRIWPVFGFRRHGWTRRRIPHVLLLGWPAGRAYPGAKP